MRINWRKIDEIPYDPFTMPEPARGEYFRAVQELNNCYLAGNMRRASYIMRCLVAKYNFRFF